MSALISVIVPVYNIELYLDRCISSILNQKYNNIELLLIDDGSTDSSLDICKKWEQRDDRVRVFQQENSGVSVARNVGIENSHGQYISFIDGDDVVDANIYSKFEEFYKAGVDLIRFRCKTFYGKFGVKSQNYVEGLLNFENLYDKYEIFFKGNTFGSVCFTLFKKEIISNIRFDAKYRYGEDYLFYFYILEKVKTAYISDEVLYFYMINYSSATRKIDLKKELKEIRDHFNVDSEVNKYLISHGLNSLLDNAWDSTISATKNWLKNLSKNYSYKQFRTLVLELRNSQEYSSYLLHTDNYHKQNLEVVLNNASFLYYAKEKSVGCIKKVIKTVLYKI